MDVILWPYSVSISCELSIFSASLLWPADDGISLLELFILFEHWVGHRLLSGKVVRVLPRAAVLFVKGLFFACVVSSWGRYSGFE